MPEECTSWRYFTLPLRFARGIDCMIVFFLTHAGRVYIMALLCFTLALCTWHASRSLLYPCALFARGICLQVVNKAMGNDLYDKSDHKWLMTEVVFEE
jgi:hypothetical protein